MKYEDEIKKRGHIIIETKHKYTNHHKWWHIPLFESWTHWESRSGVKSRWYECPWCGYEKHVSIWKDDEEDKV